MVEPPSLLHQIVAHKNISDKLMLTEQHHHRMIASKSLIQEGRSTNMSNAEMLKDHLSIALMPESNRPNRNKIQDIIQAGRTSIALTNQ